MKNNFSKKNKSTNEKEFNNENVNINSVHGADINSAAELYGLEADKIIDFSSNINPFIVNSMDKIARISIHLLSIVWIKLSQLVWIVSKNIQI